LINRPAVQSPIPKKCNPADLLTRVRERHETRVRGTHANRIDSDPRPPPPLEIVFGYAILFKVAAEKRCVESTVPSRSRRTVFIEMDA
jgi:hypothetical protein